MKTITRILSIMLTMALLTAFAATPYAGAAEDPDDLYQKGRFADAEKAYAQMDMNRPKDLRYRYNRGCAAFRSEDYKGATAAFSSVLRRAEHDDLRFKAAYNLGITAHRQGDFESAVSYFKKALQYDPDNGDAGHNLEMSLRAREKQKKQKPPDKKPPGQEDGDSEAAEKDGSGKDGDGSKDPSEAEKQKQESAEKQEGKQDGGKKTPENQDAQGKEGQNAKEKPPRDLSGDLAPLRPMEEDQDGEQKAQQGRAMIDRKKAEALLDNIQENRSKYLRFQVPEEKRRGVASGKDW